MPFQETDIVQLYEWYQSLERRLAPILDVVPFTNTTDLRRTVTPRAVSILVEAASIVDSVLRTLFPDYTIRLNGRRITRDSANIYDFNQQLEPQLNLGSAKTLVMCPTPFVLSPFQGWTADYPHSMRWWTAYNRLKHHRLQWASESTMYSTLEALCALHQLMTRIPQVVALAFRFGWVELAGYNPEVLFEGLPDRINATLSEFLAYTNYFCTPLASADWQDIAKIRPGVYKNSTRLIHFLGRMMESR